MTNDQSGWRRDPAPTGYHLAAHARSDGSALVSELWRNVPDQRHAPHVGQWWASRGYLDLGSHTSVEVRGVYAWRPMPAPPPAVPTEAVADLSRWTPHRARGRFEDALVAAKNIGYLIRRSSWPAGRHVAVVEVDALPHLVIRSGPAPRPTAIWTPSREEIFADDWESAWRGTPEGGGA